MATDLKQRLNDDVKISLKSGDKRRVGALRLILAAVKQIEIDSRTTLTDDEVTAVLTKQAKQRRESINQFEQAGRADLVAQENFELELITHYLPEPLAPDDIKRLIEEAINTVGASTVKDMGKVMGHLRPQVQGRTDMGAIGAKIKELLS